MEYIEGDARPSPGYPSFLQERSTSAIISFPSAFTKSTIKKDDKLYKMLCDLLLFSSDLCSYMLSQTGHNRNVKETSHES